MKEGRRSSKEIIVQDDNIMENTSARFPLTFRILLLVDVYMQSQKTQRKLDRRFV